MPFDKGTSGLDITPNSVEAERTITTDNTAYSVVDTDFSDAASGDGTRASPWTGGVLQAAIDTKDSAVGREPGAVRLLGTVKEDGLDGSGGCKIEGVSPHSKIEHPDTDHLFDLTTADWYLQDLWLKGSGSTTNDLIRATNSGRELWLNRMEMSGGGRYGINVDGQDTVFASDLYLEGSTFSEKAIRIRDTDNVVLDGIHSTANGDVLITGSGGSGTTHSTDVQLSNINLEGDGKLEINNAKRVTGSGIRVRGADHGVELAVDSAEDVCLQVIAKDNDGRGIIMNANTTDVSSATVYGHVRNNRKGVTTARSGQVFIGTSTDNTDEDILCDGSDCTFIGHFGDVKINGDNNTVVGRTGSETDNGSGNTFYT